MKEWMAKLKELPRLWLVTAAVLLLLTAWWIKKIIGLDGFGITVDYPAIPSLAVVLMILSIIALVGISAYLLSAKKFSLHRMFVICGLLLGSIYLFVCPPMSAPDEWAHYVSAYKISNHLLWVEAVDENGAVMVQKEEMDADVQAFSDAGEYQYFWGNLFGRETGDEMVSSERGPNGTYIAPYLPQALGITLARIFGFNFATRIMFGRIFNLVWSVLAISVAIRWIPFGKKIIFMVGLLPMTLHELASNSYDAWIIAFSLMFIAYCMKLAYEKERVEKRDLVILAGLIGLLMPCKVVYVPLAGLCLLIPREKFGTVKHWLISAGIVLGVMVLMVLLNSSLILGQFLATGSGDQIISQAGKACYPISYFLENPIELPKIILNTLTTQGMRFSKDYYQSMLGVALGHLDYTFRMSGGMFLVLQLLVLLFCLPVDGETKVFRKGNKVWMFVLCIGVGLLVMLSMLFAHTPMDSPYIEGVQGRYFLPVLPLAAMVLFKDGNLILKKDPEKLLILGYTCFHLLLLITLFGQVITVHLIAAA